MKKLAGLLLAGTTAFVILQNFQPASQAQEAPEMKTEMKKDMDTSHLTEEQKYVMLGDGTEQAFHNKYWDNHEAGIYVDAITGEPLFSSTDKYDSGTGWPSFTKPINANFTTTKTDNAFGMSRTEVRSSSSGGHLGHVFDDGPADKGGKRYCINSASLRFVPVADLLKENYGQYLPLFVGGGGK